MPQSPSLYCSFLFFYHTPTTEIYTLSLHDALPISWLRSSPSPRDCASLNSSSAAVSFASASSFCCRPVSAAACASRFSRSEEHTSELQSQSNLVCRLLLEKKK